MWVKLNNGSIEVFEGRYAVNAEKCVYYINPTDEQMRECGFKKFVPIDTPLEHKEGFHIEVTYNETDTQIIEEQIYAEDIVEAEDIPVDAEAVE